MSTCTYIDGIASSQCIDTAGEIVDLAGLDCTTLIGAACNWEHLKDQPNQIVGKILEYKKIFSEKDCENDRHAYYWNKCKIPFLYVMGRLFDDKKPSSVEVAALFKDDAEHPDEQDMLGFSIEGAKIDKINQVITKSIARKVTLTNLPANKSCISEMIPSKNPNQKDSLDSIFKSEVKYEIELFKFEENIPINEFLKKKEEMKKQVASTGMPSSPGGILENSEIKKSEAKWSGGTVKGNAVHYQHPEHGTLSIHKQPNGEFHVKHQGAMAGLKGQKGSFSSAPEAGAHAKNYMNALSSKKVLSPQMHNRQSPQVPGNLGKEEIDHSYGLGVRKERKESGPNTPNPERTADKRKSTQHSGEVRSIKNVGIMPPQKIGKSLEAGSAISAPGNLAGGAVLGKEHLDKKIKKYENAGQRHKANSQVSGVPSQNPSPVLSLSEKKLNLKKKENIWLTRAEEEYNKWEKREEFETFMAKKLPHLTKGEIKAIGQTLALGKSLKMEKAISRLNPAYQEDDKMHSYMRKFNDAVMGAPMANKEKLAKDSDIIMASEKKKK